MLNSEIRFEVGAGCLVYAGGSLRVQLLLLCTKFGLYYIFINLRFRLFISAFALFAALSEALVLLIESAAAATATSGVCAAGGVSG